jgi:hypothetical protein
MIITLDCRAVLVLLHDYRKFIDQQDKITLELKTMNTSSSIILTRDAYEVGFI